eukprot:765700-Hanusia_phi.AAC.9
MSSPLPRPAVSSSQQGTIGRFAMTSLLLLHLPTICFASKTAAAASYLIDRNKIDEHPDNLARNSGGGRGGGGASADVPHSSLSQSWFLMSGIWMRFLGSCALVRRHDEQRRDKERRGGNGDEGGGGMRLGSRRAKDLFEDFLKEVAAVVRQCWRKLYRILTNHLRRIVKERKGLETGATLPSPSPPLLLTSPVHPPPTVQCYLHLITSPCSHPPFPAHPGCPDIGSLPAEISLHTGLRSGEGRCSCRPIVKNVQEEDGKENIGREKRIGNIARGAGEERKSKQTGKVRSKVVTMKEIDSKETG